MKLSSDTDATLYNQPLTLIVQVPADWKKCTVTQGASTAEAALQNGRIMFDARPNAELVVLKP